MASLKALKQEADMLVARAQDYRGRIPVPEVHPALLAYTHIAVVASEGKLENCTRREVDRLRNHLDYLRDTYFPEEAEAAQRSKLTVEDVVKVTQMIVDANPLGYTLPAGGEPLGYIVQEPPSKGPENAPWVWVLSRRPDSDTEKKGMFTEDLCEGTLQEVLEAAKKHGFL